MVGQMVSFPSNGRTTEGYLARPASGSGPGIVVVQEWWGLVDHIKDVADRFAAEGFVALAPDFYHGQQSTEPDECGKLMMALNIDQTAKDARGAVYYLAGLAETTGDTVGVVGFCMGGQLALLTGTVAPAQVSAVVDFYGVHPNVKPDYTRMRASVLGIFAENDSMTNAEAVTNLDAALAAAGVAHEFHTYPGTDHAFFNDTRPEVYDQQAAEDAWRRTLQFFRRYVR